MTPRPARCILLFVLAAAAASSAGCAKYEYDIVAPAELAQHVDAKGTAGGVIERPDAPALRYAMRTVDNRLVVHVHNPGDAPVRLLGDQSTAVDPRGQSHPLRSQTIAPQSFIRLILPPQPPQVSPSGPSIGIGFGTVYGGGYPHRYGYSRIGYGYGWDPWYDYPRYYTVYDENAVYWNWDGETEVRLVLVYQRGEEKPFNHEFVIRRRKM